MPRSRRASARKSSISSPRSAGRSRVSCRRRCSAAKAIASSCSGRGVTERLAIARMGHRGDGIAETRDQAVYVPYALPGETVEVEAVPGHPDRRHLLAVERASPERIAAICPHFGTCGGCALQHWRSASYRAWKRGLVIEALAQVGLEAPVADLI